MGKTLSLKLNDKELKKVNLFLKEKDITPSELLRKALWSYVNEVNQKVNLCLQEKDNKKVNPQIQVIENYELLRHYKEEIDWLRDRVEYFEGSCKDLQHDIASKIEAKPKKETSMSWVRM